MAAVLPPEFLAALDLGSNSFHLAIAKAVGNGLHVIDRMQERVQLRAGLSDDNILDEDTQRRALEALERFGQRLRDVPGAAVRAVGTDTLRVAKNAGPFLGRASSLLNHPIEVLSGEEEARLIYRGVAQTLPHADGARQLVIDIGGGSTECVIGTGFDAQHLASLHIGSIGMTRKYFRDGAITRERFRRAQISAQLAFERLPAPFFRADWSRAYGSSGTMIAIEEILHLNAWSSAHTRGGVITKDGLTRLREALIDAGHADRLQIAGLKSQRAGIIAGGVAIARAAFKALPLKGLQSTTAALREGVLYDLLGRFLEGDIRESTIDHLMQRFHVDPQQAARVEQMALKIFARARWLPSRERRQARSYLRWAARLHELGLAISFHGYHKHGAYILENTPLPGFSRDDSRVVAALVLMHRKKLLREQLDALPEHLSELTLKLAVLLRLAVRLCRSRSQEPAPEVGLEIQGRVITLSLPDGYLDRHPLTQADFADEAERLATAGFELIVR